VKDFNANPGTAFSIPNFVTACGIARKERMKPLAKEKGEIPAVVEPKQVAEPNLPARGKRVSMNAEMVIAFSPLGYVMGTPTVMMGKMSSIVRGPMIVNLSVLIPPASPATRSVTGWRIALRERMKKAVAALLREGGPPVTSSVIMESAFRKNGSVMEKRTAILLKTNLVVPAHLRAVKKGGSHNVPLTVLQGSV